MTERDKLKIRTEGTVEKSRSRFLTSGKNQDKIDLKFLDHKQ